MPATKPTKLPRWATSPNANTTEPNEGKKDAGMYVAERPPAAYFNWLFNLIYGWLAWLGDFEVVAHTWTALQTFAAGIGGSVSVEEHLTVGGQATVNSALTVAGEVDHSNRLKSGAPINATDLKLVSQHPGYGTGAGSVRRYVSGAGATLKLYEVVNAISEEGVWSREVAGQPAFLTELGVAGARMLYWPVDEVGAAFSRELSFGAAGVKWVGTTTGTTGANPPASTPLKNELRAVSVCKAQAYVTNLGNVPTLADGVNIASVSNVTSGGESCWRFTFPSGGEMADANYRVEVTTGYNGTYDSLMRCKPIIVAKATTHFDVTMFDPQTGSGGGNNGNIALDVLVFGKQTT